MSCLLRQLSEPADAMVIDTHPQLDDEQLYLEPHQQLLNFLFDKAAAHNLQRTATSVYTPEITMEGHNTRAYMYTMEIEQWIVRQITPREDFPIQYAAYTERRATPGYLARVISSMPDVRFPFLTQCATLGSFRNGIFDARNKQIYLYERRVEEVFGSNVHSVQQLAPHISTGGYFDFAIPLAWLDPAFDCIAALRSVLSTQKEN